MRIVQALGWYYPESLGGTEIYVSGLSRRLQEAGHELFIAAPDPTTGADRSYLYEGIPIYRYPIPDKPTRDECQGKVPVRGAERFHSWLKRLQPDVVHMHTFVTGLGLSELKAAKATGARLIVTTHSSSLGFVCQRGTLMRWGEHLCDGICESSKCASCELQHRGLPRPIAKASGSIPPALSRMAMKISGKIGTALGMRSFIMLNRDRQREMLATIDKFVLLSQFAFDAVVANGAPAEKVCLNRLGISSENFFRKPGPDEHPTKTPVKVGYLGRFEIIKGVCDLAKAVSQLPHEVPVRVEFRGPAKTAAERSVLDKLKLLAGNDSRFIFAPPVAASEVQTVLAGYDLLCCPSICLEGGPTVAIEAHAVGTPVIGTRIGGLAELITDGVNGRLVAPGDWQTLAVVLREIAAEPSLTIDEWRKKMPPIRTMDEVATDYLKIYNA